MSHPDRYDAAMQIDSLDRGFAEAIEALDAARRRLAPAMARAGEAIADCFSRGGKVLICGNGGSAAEAQHFAAEFVGRFKLPGRAALPAIALCADSAVLTAWSNDFGYDDVFGRQVEAFGRDGDILIGISTSGRSRNLVQAFEAARRHGLRCIALLGGDGGELARLADLSVIVPSSDTQRIQEVQALVVHLICELVEERLMRDGPSPPGPLSHEGRGGDPATHRPLLPASPVAQGVNG